MLAPLGLDDVGQLIADALHCAPNRAAPLARLVQEKTAGNPFFAIQFLTALAEERLLAFDYGKTGWSWDLDHIRAKGFTDNVVELMVGKLGRLPVEMQKALQWLACLGNSAEATTLSLVHGTSEERVHADMWEAVCAGLVERRGARTSSSTIASRRRPTRWSRNDCAPRRISGLGGCSLRIPLRKSAKRPSSRSSVSSIAAPG